MDYYVILPYLKAAAAGALAAASTDFLAFKKFQTFSEFKDYNWRVAVFRWTQGAVLGVAAAFGLNAVL